MESDIRVLDIELAYHSDKLRIPLKFGKVTMTESISLVVKVSVENRRGEVAEGFGAMPLADKWAFPDPNIPSEKKIEAMKLIAERTCSMIKERYARKFSHPLDMMLGAREEIMRIAKVVKKDIDLETVIPILATLVATSPIDASLHDSFGRVNGISSYEGYGRRFMKHDLSRYLGDAYRGRFISDYLRPEYAVELPVFHLVGALDKLTSDEVDDNDPNDGLPVSLEDWIERDGIFCFKVKLSGIDIDWDVRRTRDVAQVAHQALSRKGIRKFFLSADANEMNPSPEATLEYLRELRRISPLAFDCLLYIEQPTDRDISQSMFSMKEVAQVKPVLADEAVTDLRSFDLALRLGWSGMAVKTCKWHSSSLLYIAKMEHERIPYSIQDLTCTGLALVHSAGLAARSRPILGFEYNARQYLPFAFKKIQDAHRSLFEVKDGFVKMDSLSPIGLGFSISAF